MNREQIKYWMDNLEYHNRFGELSEDDKILLWLARNVYKLTEGMPEEVEQPKKKRKNIEYLGNALAPAPVPMPPANAAGIRAAIDAMRGRQVPPREPAFGNWIVPAVDIEVEGPDEHLREE